MKPANFAPWYAALYPEFAEITRKHGYALSVHGSMARDFDVVAIPWREHVSTPREVIDDILANFAVKEIGEPTDKNHGRVAYTLSIGFGDCFADLSFMPAWNTRANADARLVEALREAIGAIEDDSGLDEAICCSGHDCGCRASTHRDLLLHNLRAALSEVSQ